MRCKLIVLVSLVLLIAMSGIVSADTLIVYTGNTEDGEIYSYNPSGYTSYTATRNAEGYGAPNNLYYVSISLESHTTSGQYVAIVRTFMDFNTSVLPDTCTVGSATISVMGIAAGSSNALGSPTYGITSFSPTNPALPVKDDFNKYGSDYLSDTKIAYADWVVESYANNYTLNTLGLSNISKTGYSNFYLRDSWDITNDTTGLTWASGVATTRGYYQNNIYGISPILTITYSTASFQ